MNASPLHPEAANRRSIGLLVPPSNGWIKAIGALRRNYGFSIAFLGGDDRQPGGWDSATIRNVDAPFFSTHQIDQTLRGLMGGSGNVPYSPLSHHALQELSEDHLTLTRIARRYFPTRLATPGRDADRLAQDSLDLANSILTGYSPDVVVQCDTPHLLLDYAVAAICRLRGIDHVYFGYLWTSAVHQVKRNGLAVSNRGYVAPRFRGQMASSLAAHLEDAREDYATYLAATGIASSRPKSLPHGSGISRATLDRKLRTAREILRSGRGGRERSVWRRGRNQGPLELLAFRFFRGVTSDRLAREYARLTQSFRLPPRYAYMALHYQPEASTLPLSGVLVDQIRTATYLREMLPSDLELVVKEHPRQFQRGWEGAKERSPADYRQLADMPGISLAPANYDQFGLLDRAELVITGTGTVGVEAIARGKAVLVFGTPWYQSLPGVISVHDLTPEELLAQLDSLVARSRSRTTTPAEMGASVCRLASEVFPGDRFGRRRPPSGWNLSLATPGSSDQPQLGLEAGVIAALGIPCHSTPAGSISNR